eukprot:scpid84316/ scgid12653/ 
MCADIHGAVRCAARPPVPSSRRQRRAWSTCVILACFVLCLHSPCVQVHATVCETPNQPQEGTARTLPLKSCNSTVSTAQESSPNTSSSMTSTQPEVVCGLMEFECNPGFVLHGTPLIECALDDTWFAVSEFMNASSLVDTSIGTVADQVKLKPNLTEPHCIPRACGLAE